MNYLDKIGRLSSIIDAVYVETHYDVILGLVIWSLTFGGK